MRDLARVAYEAYANEMSSEFTMPAWDDMLPIVHGAWGAAIEAVLQEVHAPIGESIYGNRRGC